MDVEIARAAANAASEAECAKAAVLEAAAAKEAASARTAELRRQLAAFDAAEAAKAGANCLTDTLPSNSYVYQPRFMGPLGRHIEAMPTAFTGAPPGPPAAVVAPAADPPPASVVAPIIAFRPGGFGLSEANKAQAAPGSSNFTYEPRFMSPFQRPACGVGGSVPTSAAPTEPTPVPKAAVPTMVVPQDSAVLVSLSGTLTDQQTVAEEAAKDATAAKAALDDSAAIHAAAAERTREIKRQLEALDRAEAAAKQAGA